MGWHAWNGRETYEATRADALLDDDLWPPLLDVLRHARRRIDLSQLLFDPDFRALPTAARLTDVLQAATARGARVRILVNENAAIPDSYDELRAHFAGTPVEVKALPMTPNVMHVKLFLVDDDAFLIDAPFEQKYADSRTHVFQSAHRRGWQPFHAVSLRLGGPIVTRLSQLFDALWTGEPLHAPVAKPVTRGVQLVWTAPAGVWAREPAAGVLEAYERALHHAKRFIYLETQYFTSPRIASAIDAALAREPRLEVILLLNEHMDVPTYDGWQVKRLHDLGFPEHPRLGVFSLWAPRRVESEPAMRRVYIHSKLAMADDEWATIGSANLDSISLHEAEEFGIPVTRNVELNAVFTDAAFVAALRRRVWGEHLGDTDVWTAHPPPEGWLAHWRRLAEENAVRFRAGEVLGPARIMPYGALTALGARGVVKGPAAGSLDVRG